MYRFYDTTVLSLNERRRPLSSTKDHHRHCSAARIRYRPSTFACSRDPNRGPPRPTNVPRRSAVPAPAAGCVRKMRASHGRGRVGRYPHPRSGPARRFRPKAAALTGRTQRISRPKHLNSPHDGDRAVSFVSAETGRNLDRHVRLVTGDLRGRAARSFFLTNRRPRPSRRRGSSSTSPR